MTMEASIRNIRGVADVRLPLAGITLLAGPNGAGKTSVCTAIACAFTAATDPITGKRGGDKGLLVRENEITALATVSRGDAGAVTMVWDNGRPEVSVRGGEAAPRASRLAVGLDRWGLLDGRERAALAAETFKATPTKAELRAALPDETAESLDQLWLELCNRGWDKVADAAAGRARDAKAAWREVTGETWGKDKAASWRPKHLTADSVDELKTRLQDLKARRDAALRASGPRPVVDLTKLEKDVRLASAARDGAAARLAALKVPERGGEPLACPHCGALTQLVGGALVPAQEPPSAKQRQEIDAARAAAERTRKEHAAAEAALALAIQQKERAATAGGPSTDDPDALDAEIAQVIEAGRAAASYARAGELHAQILRDLAIAAVAAPDGLRKRKLAEVLAIINGWLLTTSKAFGCAPIELDGDLHLSLGGRAYPALSASERWRCDVAMQLAFAEAESASIVVIDGADILDRDGRNGLLRALRPVAQDRAVLVAMTFGARDLAPDLGKAGLGSTAWIERGAVTALNPSVAEKDAA